MRVASLIKPYSAVGMSEVVVGKEVNKDENDGAGLIEGVNFLYGN